MLFGALGQFPLGGFDPADSLSVADPLPGLLADPLAPREFLLRAAPLDLDGNPVAVDLSGGGYVSRSTDSPFKHFQPAIARPGDFSASLPLPALCGGTQTGAGAVTLNNGDALRDSDLTLDWLGAELEVLLGEKDSSLADFTPIIRGRTAGVSRGLDDATVMFRDARLRLQRALQPRKYWGMGAALYFDGTGVVDYGDVLDQGASDSFTVEVLFRSSVSGVNKVLAGKKQHPNDTGAGFLLYYETHDALISEIADGSISIVVATVADGGAQWLDDALHRASMVVDRVAQEIRLYVDGALVATSPSIAGVGSLANARKLLVGRPDDVSGPYWIGVLDDFRLWSVARTREEIAGDMHQELLGDEAGLALYSTFDEGFGATVLDLTSGGHNGTITGAAWTGSLEGDASLFGKPKPRAVGVRRQVSPACVDPQNNVYQFNDGSMLSIDAMREACDPFSSAGNVGSIANLYATSLATTDYLTMTSLGLVRLGRTPTGVVTGDWHGDDGGSHGYQETDAGCARKVLDQFTDFGADEVDDAALTALGAEEPAVVGFYWDEEITQDAALDEVFRSAWARWGADRLSRVTCGRTFDPSTRAATVSLTRDDLIEPAAGGRFRDDPMGVRVGEVRVLYRPYHTTLDGTQVAGTVGATERADFGKPFRVARATDPDRSDDADELEIETSLDSYADALRLARMILTILKGDRRVLKLTVEGGLLSYFIGTVFRVTLGRYDYSDGKNGMVVKLSEFFGDSGSPDRVEVDLFV